jgi:signal transduction histidine kinase
LLLDPAVLEGALWHLQHPGPGFVDWDQPTTRPIYHASLTCARLGALVAVRSGRCDADLAWVAGLVAPLGWLAVCAADPERAADCRADPDLACNPLRTQQRHWGYDQASIARRLARRWQLPAWLAALTGHLALGAETAERLGADPGLFLVTRFAVGLAEEQGVGLHVVGTDTAEVARSLGLSASEQQALQAEAHVLAEQHLAPPPARPLQNEPLLADLLHLAAENRRLHGVPVLDRLAGDLDRLHQALEEQRASEAVRLRAQKLSALAEFAAGAGHEINNPLAVISGQAQYLLGHLEIADGRLQNADYPAATECSEQSAILNLKSEIVSHALQRIIGQAQRIHQILNELMQFARPSRPHKQPVDVAGLVREVVTSLGVLAAERRIELRVGEPLPDVTLSGDVRQLRTALGCLLRNALEAAPPDGWAGVHVETSLPDQVDLVVEDSGSGPPRARREHLFDPFFSGREAGRGRGLGLPTAWRLAREHGGDVFLDDRPGGPTRFVLRLPASPLSVVRGPSPNPAEAAIVVSGAADPVRVPYTNGVQATDNGR